MEDVFSQPLQKCWKDQRVQTFWKAFTKARCPNIVYLYSSGRGGGINVKGFFCLVMSKNDAMSVCFRLFSCEEEARRRACYSSNIYCSRFSLLFRTNHLQQLTCGAFSQMETSRPAESDQLLGRNAS